MQDRSRLKAWMKYPASCGYSLYRIIDYRLGVLFWGDPSKSLYFQTYAGHRQRSPSVDQTLQQPADV